MSKTGIARIGEKNRVIANIIEAIDTRWHFLMLGHTSPDDDCIASMISFALILRMFDKEAMIHLDGRVHDHFSYLLDICSYNSIRVTYTGSPLPSPIDTIVLCDTPKPSMIGVTPGEGGRLADPALLRIEIDHHLGADSNYFGDDGYRLVSEASSASELVGHLLLKLRDRRDLLERYQIAEVLPRNLVLTILTGIIGDSNMGQFLKSRRERRYYEIFSGMFNDLLAKTTTKRSNFFTKDQVHDELQRLSSCEVACFRFMMDRKRFSSSVGYVALSQESTAAMHESFDAETIVSTARLVADHLAEESARVSLVAFYDAPEKGDLIQFRVRRAGAYKGYDLRKLIGLFSIANGGGHEGAIAFRVPRDQVPDFDGYIAGIVSGIEAALA